MVKRGWWRLSRAMDGSAGPLTFGTPETHPIAALFYPRLDKCVQWGGLEAGRWRLRSEGVFWGKNADSRWIATDVRSVGGERDKNWWEQLLASGFFRFWRIFNRVSCACYVRWSKFVGTAQLPYNAIFFKQSSGTFRSASAINLRWIDGGCG